MPATVAQATTTELLYELGRRIPDAQPSAVGQFIHEQCELSPEYKMTFAQFADRARPLGLSKIKLSQALARVRGVSVYAGTANVRMIKGIRWK